MEDSFNYRKTDVQDILSSFSRDILPSEFKPELFRNIDEDQRLRPPIEWTIPEDLEGSLMQWGIHDNDCYNFLRRTQPPSVRSVLFHQKIARRLKAEMEIYRDIDWKRSPSDLWQEVQEASVRLRTIVEQAWSRQLQEGRVSSATPFIDLLREVCQDSLDRRTSHSGQSRQSNPHISLFHILVAEAPPNHSPFMLEPLEWMARNSVGGLGAHASALELINTQLASSDAPLPYRKKLQEIIDRAKSANRREKA